MGGIELRRTLHFFVAALMVVLAGCGGAAEKTCEVTGTVSFRGKTLSQGVVVLHPQQGRPLEPASIGTDGVYRLEAPAGEYRVSIISLPTLESVKELEETSAAPAQSPIPGHYGNPDTSGISISVEPEGQKRFDFSMK